MRMLIGDKEFDVKVAETDEARKKGLIGVRKGSMPANAGLVLKFDKPKPANITMKGMNFSLDLIFVKGGKVQKVVSAEPDQTDISINDISDMVVEVPKGSGKDITSDTQVTWVGKKNDDGSIELADGGPVPDEGTMHVLDNDGAIQASLEGDERIFSRKHTAKLFELAGLAAQSKSDDDYKKVGLAMVNMIHKQDTQDPQYAKN